jgi:hypothetical protein
MDESTPEADGGYPESSKLPISTLEAEDKSRVCVAASLDAERLSIHAGLCTEYDFAHYIPCIPDTTDSPKA